jgi:cytochrome c553
MLRKNNRSYATSALCWLVGLCLLASQIQLGQIALGQVILGQENPSGPDFASQIKPILANHCWSCHGPDEQSRKADLRLDRRDDALSAKSIVPGKASESPLAERIDSTDPDSVMPPPETKKPLTEQQRQLLKDWIDAGAKYSQHWSFAPPDKTSLANNGLARPVWQRIDQQVALKLRAHGLNPTDPANPETLLRRVSLDLTGLPPTLEELDASLKDTSENAFEKAVDRLLQSDAYAERMASQWLDLSRYADTNGYNNDEDRQMWPWRDWVINAYRENMPYDQFLTEQLAGDLLPNASLQQQVATGFLRNQGHNTEGGIIQEEYRVEYVADRVHTVATVFLGLSMQCARCHDHKIDPITQAEYYRFFSLVNNLEEKQASYSNFVGAEPFVRVPTAEQIDSKKQLATQLDQLKSQLQNKEQQIEQTWTAWAKASSDPVIEETLGTTQKEHIDFEQSSSLASQSLWDKTDALVYVAGKQGTAASIENGRFLESKQLGKLKSDRPFSISLWVQVPSLGSMAILSRMDEAMNFRGYDMLLVNGKLEVHLVDTWPSNAMKISSQSTIAPNQWHHLTLTYDGSKKAAGANLYIDGKSVKFDVPNNNLTGSLETDKPFHLGLREKSLPFTGSIDDLRIFDGVLSPVDVERLAQLQLPESKIAWARKAWGELTEDQRNLAKSWTREKIDPEHGKLQLQVVELEKKIAGVDQAAPAVMVMREMNPPRETFILKRGQYDQPTTKVEPGIPESLRVDGIEQPTNRLQLAKWLTHPKNPLTARVAVNRLWEQCFGVGIVRTSEDFGGSGEYPSNPELLDMLALELIESRWDVRAMLKQIVLSKTYRQASGLSQEHKLKDPENRWFARGPRHRLSAEAIRDNALAISGLLVPKVGGPSVKPYQPAGLWEDVTVERRGKYVADTGEGLFRRGMYTFWKRTCPPPAMVSFDAPNREVCVARRSRTNTPLQALVLLNDPTYIEAARAFASDVLKVAQGDELARLNYAYRKALARQIRPEEIPAMRELLELARKEFSEDAKRVDAFLSVGTVGVSGEIPKLDLAVWTVACSAILNLDETITKY